MLGVVGRRLARSLRPTVAAHLERLAAPAVIPKVRRPARFFSTGSSPSEYPWEATIDEIADGEEGLDPPGTPWNPAPVAEDYDNTLSVLLNDHRVEDALDILGRMVKRGFRPSPEIVDLLYTTTKAKPEYQALVVKTISSLDTTALN